MLNLVQETILPDGVKSIGTYAFSECSGLETAVLPDSIESIGSSESAETSVSSAEITAEPSVTAVTSAVTAAETTVSETVTTPVITKSYTAEEVSVSPETVERIKVIVKKAVKKVYGFLSRLASK